MPVCRICLTQMFKNCYSMDHGVPNLREKLIYCVPHMDLKMLNNNMGMCESCVNSLDSAYDFIRRTLSTQITLKAMMGNLRKDYENLETYAFEASVQKLRYEEQRKNNENSSNLLSNPVTVVTEIKSDMDIESNTDNFFDFDDDNHNDNPVTENSIITFTTATDFVPVNPNSLTEQQSSTSPFEEQNPLETNDIDEESINAPVNASFERLSRFIEGKMCHICYRQYPNRTCLQSHVKTVHRNNGNNGLNVKRKLLSNLLSNLTPDDLKDINAEVGKACTKTECDRCEIYLNCMHELQYHITKVHKKYAVNDVHFTIECQRCRMSFSHKYLDTHLKGHQLSIALTDMVKKVNVIAPIARKDASLFVIKFYQCKYCKQLYSNKQQEHSHHCERA